MADRPENLEECIHSVRFLETKDVETLSVLIGYGCDLCDGYDFQEDESIPPCKHYLNTRMLYEMYEIEEAQDDIRGYNKKE